jgi:hypothetical protein
MGANDHHQLYLSSPDSTYSRSSSSSSPVVVNKKQKSTTKSFLISDILKPDFGHAQDKCNIPLSPTTTNDSTSSSSNTHSQPGGLPAWVFCTRYSDRPSAGMLDPKLLPNRVRIFTLRSSREKVESLRLARFQTSANSLHKQSVATFKR